ncbi:Lipase (class 3) [Carpediemonas membranifera]|uniref:Lipase (Class 3) n=1 Tax=Carpediemonas membranifera TaxID=201153 RepID=A0A8J6E568_9EUKA|nr:Lipase (class 3) [Carpediemonas membranifera]|eukprot:KAG9395362.1 Lipase (class 3) [Carpediemonas membranifera]
MELSCVAYCGKASEIDNWTCPTCKRLHDIDYHHYIVNKHTDIFLAILTESTANGKTLHIAFRGTEDTINWVENFEAWQETYHEWPDTKVHRGFAKAYKSVRNEIHQEVSQLIHKGGITNVHVTGHSLGGAMATLCAVDLRTSGVVSHSLPLGTYTFGEPRVGDSAFKNLVDRTVDYHYRVVHYADLVPHVPAEKHMVGHYHHSPREIWYNEAFTDFRTCDGSGEDPTCSNTKANWLKHPEFAVHCHTHYFGIHTSTCVC